MSKNSIQPASCQTAVQAHTSGEGRLCTRIYQHDTKTGKDVYVLDAGGSLSGMDIIWSELPFVEPEQIDKILGVLPF